MFNFPFKILGWIIKASLFAAVILILGNVLHIGGKSVSDQVKTSLSHAEQVTAVTSAPSRVLDTVSDWTSDVADRAKRAVAEAKKPAKRATPNPASPNSRNEISAKPNRKTASANIPSPEHPRKPLNTNNKVIQANPNSTESILASERQELRELIRELNSSTEKLTAN